MFKLVFKKTSMKFFSSLIFFFCVFVINAQNQITINGTVKHDSIGLQDIHVINRTSKMATTTRLDGKFSIPVSLGDSMEFTSIVYKNRKIAISENHIKNKLMLVYLESHIEELNEVFLARKTKINHSNLDIDPNQQLDRDFIDRTSAPDMKKIVDPTQANSSINFVSIYRKLTKGLRKKRKERLQSEQEIKRLKNEFPEKLKYSLGAEFFAYWLRIPNHEINLFMDFCQSNGLGELYKSKDIDVTDFLIKQSKEFQSIRN